MPGTIRSMLRDEQPVMRSDGTFLRDYLHVDDVVGALSRAGRRRPTANPGEAFNFSDESPASVLEIYDGVLRRGGRPATSSRRSSIRRSARSSDQYLDSSLARSELGVEGRGRRSPTAWPATFAWYEDLLGSRRMTREQRAARGDPRARAREYHERGLPREAVRRRHLADPGERQGLRRGRDEQPRRRVARLLADDRPLRRRSSRRGFARGHGRAPRAARATPGSSANLLAVVALTSPPLGERRLQPGDEVDHRAPPASRRRSTRSSRTGSCRSSSTSSSAPTTSTSTRLDERGRPDGPGRS